MGFLIPFTYTIVYKFGATGSTSVVSLEKQTFDLHLK